MTIDASRVILGFPDTKFEPGHWILDQIANKGLGGVILYDRNIENPEQLKTLCSQMHAAAAGRNFTITIDQEGGEVARLREDKGFISSPSAFVLASAGKEELLRCAAEQATQLKELGITLNFGPVLDLWHKNSYIAAAERSYGADPVAVSACAALVVEMYREAGVKSCLKHFPGHGSSSGDTHLGMVDITETWSQDEIEPYKRLIGDGAADVVMLGHVIHKGLSDVPLSLSKFAVEMLRGELGFSGAIVTDDLQMGAIMANYRLEEAVAMADEAGVDWFLLANHEGDCGLLERVIAET